MVAPATKQSKPQPQQQFSLEMMNGLPLVFKWLIFQWQSFWAGDVWTFSIKISNDLTIWCKHFLSATIPMHSLRWNVSGCDFVGLCSAQQIINMNFLSNFSVLILFCIEFLVHSGVSDFCLPFAMRSWTNITAKYRCTTTNRFYILIFPVDIINCDYLREQNYFHNAR